MLYPQGYIINKGPLVFEKLEDKEYSWWVCLNSIYLIKEEDENGEMIYTARPESEKPLYNKEGRLNRWGFRLPDQQIKPI